MYPKYCLNKWTTIAVMYVTYAVAALLAKDKMSISSHSKRNLKTSQLMNQIYKRNIAAQLEQKQILH